ncbi:toxin-activating lysine-acyltransferase [Xanthomonas arboricola pv. pruni]|nr:toxin-activating lysine-acyltransferase [Xanthomonas arboricola pv. pruni]UQQ06746.1 toxin-activating lysine-acyltransferase [Xanthomonas arboricola pv. pruni]
MTRSRTYCQFPIACISEWIVPAVLLGQSILFRDSAGNLSGYMTWAFLAEDSERRILNDPNVLLHIGEWNEGDRLWIMDMVILDGRLKSYTRQMLDVFPDYQEVRFVRRREDGSIRKVTFLRRADLCKRTAGWG